MKDAATLETTDREPPWAEWCVRALVALAARNLEERNKTCGDGWPAQQDWNELGHTSQHAFMRAAREECGIPHDEYRAAVEASMVKYGVDLDTVWAEVSAMVKQQGR